jgi:hypothetical protein
METVYRDYAPKGVKFYYMYKSLAHPGLLGYVGPITLEERLMHIREAKRTLGSEIPWLCDSMSNDLKHIIGDPSNAEFVLDMEGVIVQLRDWSKPDILRKDLESLVGPVEKPTKVADLHMKVEPAPKNAPTGIVPPLKLEGQFMALRTKPQLDKSKNPFYVKFRAEAERELLSTGTGSLYLGFFLDPLYHVHWNNQVAPVQYELTIPRGVSVSSTKGQGPKVTVEADADPREFLIEVDRGNSTDPFRIKFHYYACTDSWCKPVTQEYLISWEADRDGGTQLVPGRFDWRSLEPDSPLRGKDKR